MDSNSVKSLVWEHSLPEMEKRRQILDQARLTVQRAKMLLATLDERDIHLTNAEGAAAAGRPSTLGL